MLPSHIPPQFPPHQAGAAEQPAQPSTAPQSTFAAQPDPVDLKGQFMLPLPMAPRSAGSALTRFVVPPRLPTLHDQLNDRAVLTAMKKIFQESSDWALKSTYGDGGTSILTYTHASRSWSPKGPVMRFIVRPDKSLERLEIQMAQEVQTVLFQEKLLPPHHLQRNLPAWVLQSQGNTGTGATETAQLFPSEAQPAPNLPLDLTQPFMLALVLDRKHRGFKSSIFMVPPRVRRLGAIRSDGEIIKAIHRFRDTLYQWEFHREDHADGGRALRFAHLRNRIMPQLIPPESMSFTIRSDNSLHWLAIETNCARYVIEFEQLTVTEPSDAPVLHESSAVEMPPLLEQENNDTIDSMTQFGMEWDRVGPEQQMAPRNPTGAPPEAHALTFRAHDSSLQMQQPMETVAQLPSQRRDDMLVIDPIYFRENIPTHYGSVTVNGPDIDADGDVHFYLERKQENASARHAANAMIGAPLFSLTDFARSAAARTHIQGRTRVARIQFVEKMQRERGFAPEYVRAAFEEAGIPLHVYPTSPEPDGRPVTDSAQFNFLDTLDTDRLLLQTAVKLHSGEENSHWVAFRQVDQTWALLDSDLEEQKIGLSPASYLKKRGVSDFTALWPKNRLLVSSPASAMKIDRRYVGDYSSRYGNDFDPLLAQWKNVDSATEPGERTGTTLMLKLAERCQAQLQAKRSARVQHPTLKIYEVSVKLEEKMEPVNVWCYIGDSGVPYIRPAPATDNVDARNELFEQFEKFAKSSTDHTHERSPVVVVYDTATARSIFNSHLIEFMPLLSTWNKDVGQRYPGTLLVKSLMSRCTTSEPQSRGVAVPGSNDLVFKFTVTLEDGMDPVRVWRGLDHNMKPYLRLAPEEGDDEARVALLRDFYTGDAVGTT